MPLPAVDVTAIDLSTGERVGHDLTDMQGAFAIAVPEVKEYLLYVQSEVVLGQNLSALVLPEEKRFIPQKVDLGSTVVLELLAKTREKENLRALLIDQSALSSAKESFVQIEKNHLHALERFIAKDPLPLNDSIRIETPQKIDQIAKEIEAHIALPPEEEILFLNRLGSRLMDRYFPPLDPPSKETMGNNMSAPNIPNFDSALEGVDIPKSLLEEIKALKREGSDG